jgi:RND family efflux transporter MFP subunit
MRKLLSIGIVVLAVAAAVAYFGFIRKDEAAAAADAQTAGEAGQAQGGQGQAGRGGRGGRGGGRSGGQAATQGGGMAGGPGGFQGFRPPMTVEVAKVSRGRVSQILTVVGNLIGEQTVDVVPRTGGRITAMLVKMGDPVRKGQVIARIEDREIVEQVRQAEASHQVAEATIRQRDADLNLAQTNVERSRNLYARQLLPKQTLDDAEARYLSSIAALDLSRAQLAQSAARLEELRINLGNTNVVSPVNGFVGKRNLDVGAFASNNQPVASVVDISSLRLVANVVEKDLRAVSVGDSAQVEVDAYPGEKFPGRIARLAPVLDPATRTASMEVEIPNRGNKLKPGMYARVDLTVEDKNNALVIPKIALVDSQGERGVYQPSADNKAKFKAVKVGIENNDVAEILEGLSEGEQVVSNGAGALKRDDQLVVANAAAGAGRGRSGARGQRGQPGVPEQGAPGGAGLDQRRPEGQGSARPEGEPGGLGTAGRLQSGQNPAGRRPVQPPSVKQQRPIA